MFQKPRQDTAASTSSNDGLEVRFWRSAYYFRLIIMFGTIIAISGLVIYLANLYKDQLSEPVRSVMIAISLSLSSSFTIYTLFELFLKRSFFGNISSRIEDSFHRTLIRHFNLTGSGLLHYSNKLPVNLLEKDIIEAKFVFIFQTFMPNLFDISSAIQDACAKGVNIRVALLDPRSPIVHTRCKEIVYDYDLFVSGIKSNVLELKSLGLNKESIKLHKHTPSVSIYGTDKVLHIGNYLQGKHAIQSPHLLLDSRSAYAQVIIEHFEKI